MSAASAAKPFGLLRLILAVLVMVQHFCADIAPPALKQAVFPYAPGNIAVLGFFVLSGFIICDAVERTYMQRPWAFLHNRLLRIAPGYWAALALSVGVHYALLVHGPVLSLDRHMIGIGYFSPRNLIANALAIFPPVRVNMTEHSYPFIPYAWALQTEMMFYLTVFACLWAQSASQYLAGQGRRLLGIAAIVAIIVAQAAAMGFVPDRLQFGAYFALGGALSYVMRGNRAAWLIVVPAAAQILYHLQVYAAEDFAVISANRAGQMALFALILAAIVWLARARQRPGTFDRRSGELSYPLYLNHYIVGIVILNVTTALTIHAVALGMVVSAALAVAAFLAVDAPLIALRKRIRTRAQE